ncbi:hypothetical protein H0V99_03215 [Candidatus Saccharibacteria bacterium]|nr:hypothetical protein [Candidatus Saccharibacteria bacterium]
MDDYYSVIFEEPKWHRIVDALAVLAIGISIGFIISQVTALFEPQSVEFIQSSPSMPKAETGKLEIPAEPVKFEEI